MGEKKEGEKKPGDFENSPPLIPSFLSIHSIQGRPIVIVDNKSGGGIFVIQVI